MVVDEQMEDRRLRRRYDRVKAMFILKSITIISYLLTAVFCFYSSTIVYGIVIFALGLDYVHTITEYHKVISDLHVKEPVIISQKITSFLSMFNMFMYSVGVLVIMWQVEHDNAIITNLAVIDNRMLIPLVFVMVKGSLLVSMVDKAYQLHCMKITLKMQFRDGIIGKITCFIFTHVLGAHESIAGAKKKSDIQ